MLMTYAAFATFGYGFGDLSALRDVRLEWLTVPVMSGLGMTCIFYSCYPTFSFFL
jgi:hypothetical protein